VPAAENVRVNDPPGAIVPESQVPLSPVDVCGVESLFIHVTLPPVLIEIGLGEYAVVVRTDAPATIETGEPPPPLIVGGFEGDVDEEPQPNETDKIAAAIASRLSMMTSCMVATSSNLLPHRVV